MSVCPRRVRGALWCYHLEACPLPRLVVEGTLQELGPLWEPSLFWGVGPTVVLDSFGGGGFFNFLKLLPPFVKGDGGGEE